MQAFTLAIPVSFNATAGAGMSKFSYATHVKRAHYCLLTYLLRMRLIAKPSVGPANSGVDLGMSIRSGEVLVFDDYKLKHAVDRDAIYDFSYYSTYTETFPDGYSHHLLVASAIGGYSMRGAG